MMPWKQYLQTLSYSRVCVISPNFGLINCNIMDVLDTRVMLPRREIKDAAVGDMFKIDFVNSKLKGIRFIAKVTRLDEARIEVGLLNCELDGSRYELTQLQELLERRG